MCNAYDESYGGASKSKRSPYASSRYADANEQQVSHELK
jgi:hypothetical protein